MASQVDEYSAVSSFCRKVCEEASVEKDSSKYSLELTPIQEFYKDANILITGGTGFIGRLLVEKLLRSCQDVSTLYLIVRDKKGKTVKDRMEELFQDIVFTDLKKQYQNFLDKIVILAGDCSLPNLGLSSGDRKLIVDKVNIIFHVAATVRFDQKLDIAVAINVRACRDLLEMAKDMKQLKSFVHVSTAYSNCTEPIIEEKVYPPAYDPYKIIAMAESLPQDILDKITPQLLNKYPNTYTFTKQIAEDVVRQAGSAGLPVAIYRPAIVVSTYQDPIPGWINNVYGATGICAGAAIGLIKVMHCGKEQNASIVPADMVVNGLIAAGWHVNEHFQQTGHSAIADPVMVYNYESRTDKPITWSDFMEQCYNHSRYIPSVKAIWYYFLFLIENRTLAWLGQLFIQTFPAFIVDTLLVCTGRQRKMMQAYNKIHKLTNALSYFSTRTFVFRSHNIRRMLQEMSAEERRIFFYDFKLLDWNKFFKTYTLGIRLYIFQDPLDTVQQAVIWYNKLTWIHLISSTLYAALLLKIVWTLFRWIF